MRLALVVVLLLLGAALQRAGAQVPDTLETTPRVARSTAPDTLRLTGAAGRPLVAHLADSVAGRAVTRYEPLRLPALALLVDHALFWRTRPQDAGRHHFPLRAHFADAPPDTVVLLIELDG